MPAGTKKTKQPQDRQSGFGQKRNYDLELPSGYTVVVKRPGVLGLVKAGIIDGLDSLTAIVQGETIPKAEGLPNADVMRIANDKERMGELMDMLDKIVAHVVVSPKIHPAPVPEDENGVPLPEPTEEQVDELREDGVAYIDVVDDTDKTFIMNFVLGGSQDLEAFREATSAAVGGARPGAADGADAE